MKIYSFDLFYGGYRTMYEYECKRFSQAIEALSREDSRISVCNRYIVKQLDKDGNPISARYNIIRRSVPVKVLSYSLTRYESTIFVPFSKFVEYLDDEKETRPENLTVAGSWYINDH